MKRSEPEPSPVQHADAQSDSIKRPRASETTASTPSSHRQESGSYAAALTRSGSNNASVSPFSSSQTTGSSLESGSRHAAGNEEADPTSRFLRAITELELQLTEKQDELRKTDRKTRELYQEEMLRLRGEIQKKCTENNRLSDERERCMNDKNRLQNELQREGVMVQMLRDQITEMTAEKGSLVDEKKKVEAELAEQKKEVLELTTGRHSLLSDIDDLREQIAQKDTELSNLETDLDTSANECGRLKKEKQDLLDETDRFNDLVKEMREELQTEKDRNSREIARRDDQKKEADAELHGLRTELQKCKVALGRKTEATRLLEEGYVLRRRKHFVEAYELFDKAVVLDIDMLLPYYHKASDYYDQADYEECVQTCKLAMTGDRGGTTDKCTMAALYSLAAAASGKLANVPEADVQQLEVGHGQISHLEDAVQFYGKSLANYYDVDIERKHERYAELLRQAYTNPRLSRDALVKGNEFFRKGEHNMKSDFLSLRF